MLMSYSEEIHSAWGCHCFVVWHITKLTNHCTTCQLTVWYWYYLDDDFLPSVMSPYCHRTYMIMAFPMFKHWSNQQFLDTLRCTTWVLRSEIEDWIQSSVWIISQFQYWNFFLRPNSYTSVAGDVWCEYRGCMTPWHTGHLHFIIAATITNNTWASQEAGPAAKLLSLVCLKVLY